VRSTSKYRRYKLQGLSRLRPLRHFRPKRRRHSAAFRKIGTGTVWRPHTCLTGSSLPPLGLSTTGSFKMTFPIAISTSERLLEKLRSVQRWRRSSCERQNASHTLPHTLIAVAISTGSSQTPVVWTGLPLPRHRTSSCEKRTLLPIDVSSESTYSW
jgi:hypothetical protein